MGTTGLAYSNLTDQAILSGAGVDSSFPLTNLQGSLGRQLWVYAQTTGGTFELIMDHGSAVVAQYFGLFAHTNTDSTSTIRVLRGTTSGGSEVWDSGSLTCWPFTPLAYSGRSFGMHVIAGAPTTARYTKITVTTVLPYVRVGRPFVGPMFIGDISPESGKTSDGWMDQLSRVGRADGGADAVSYRPELRSAAFEYSALLPAQASTFHEIIRSHSITSEVVYVRHTGDRATQQQKGFLALMRRSNALENPFFGYQSAAVTFDERGGAP